MKRIESKMQLVAMAPSGSSYIVRQSRDESLWLVHPNDTEEAEQIGEADLAVAVTFHNFAYFDAPYETPVEVAKRVNDAADDVELEDVKTTVADVQRFLRTLALDASDPILAEEVLAETATYFDVVGVLEDQQVGLELRRIRDLAKQTLASTNSMVTAAAVISVTEPSPARRRWAALVPDFQVTAAA